MQEVSLALSVPGRDPDDVFATIADFPRYATLSDAVIRVDVEDLGDGRERCTWEVRFRRGILIWTEDNVSDAARRRIDFTLVGGDLDHQVGHWQVEPAAGGSTVRFWCEFDLGIPTLAHLIEPVAAETLRENIVETCAGLFASVAAVPELAAEPGSEPGT